jgi:mRNA-degrading endonuclease RelE of RelBE toxin-antitoxin system
MVTVTLDDEAREQLSELPRLIALRVEKLLTRLQQWPAVSGVKHLRGALAGKCRLRTGDYRLQFRVQELQPPQEKQPTTQAKRPPDYLVVVEKIGHRDGFYEE